MQNLIYSALANDSHWRINKHLMDIVEPYEAIALSILLDKWNDFGRKEFFEYKTEYFLKSFGNKITDDTLKKHTDKLIERGFITKHLAGSPPISTYSILFDNIAAAFQLPKKSDIEYRKNRESNTEKIGKPPYINKTTKNNKEGEPSNFSNSLNEEAIILNNPNNTDLKTWQKKEKETPHAESNKIKMVATQEIEVMARQLRTILKKELKGDFDALVATVDADVPTLMYSFSEYWLASCGREFVKTNSKGLGASFRQWIGIPTAKDVKRAEAASSPSNHEYFFDIFEEISKVGKFTIGKEDRLQINKALNDLDLTQENWIDVCNRFRGGMGTNCEDFLTIAKSLDKEIKILARVYNNYK